MTSSRNVTQVFGRPLIYAPAVAYRDLKPLTLSALRERDLEIFEGHGPFCRRVFGIERAADTPKGDRIHVAVTFDDGQWVRQLGVARATWRTLHVIRRQRRNGMQLRRGRSDA